MSDLEEHEHWLLFEGGGRRYLHRSTCAVNVSEALQEGFRGAMRALGVPPESAEVTYETMRDMIHCFRGQLRFIDENNGGRMATRLWVQGCQLVVREQLL